MTIEQWPPFSAFTNLEQEMHILLDRLGARPWVEGFGWKPDTDIFRQGEALVVQAELPGVNPMDDLSIDLEHNVLQIRGTKVAAPDAAGADCYVSERRFGSFQRSVMLPDGIDTGAVTASFANGLLTVRVPLPVDPAPPRPNTHVEVALRP